MSFAAIDIKYRVALCCIALLMAFPVFAQYKLPGEIPTPNAASLGKYGDTPVSLYTGTPDVRIPLYDFTVRDVTMPIVLRYDASGLPVNSVPGWLGHNWTLEAGGVITRTVHGRYDEWLYPKQTLNQLSYTPKNYYQSLNVLPQMISNSSDDYSQLKEESLYQRYDLAADVFTFNFMGHTGKFFLDNSGNWKVQSDENLEIIFDYTDPGNFTSPFIDKYPKQTAIDRNQPKTIKGFKIRDAEGTLYEFGGDMNAIEFTTNFFYMSKNEDNESWHAMSWYLTKVTDKYGNELFKLSYERGTYIIQAYNACEYIRVKESGHFGWFGTYGQDISSSNSSFPYGFSISSPVYPKKIEGTNGVAIEFMSQNGNVPTEDMYRRLYRDAGSTPALYNTLAKLVRGWNSESGQSSIGAFYYLQTTDATLSKYKFKPAKDDPCDIFRYARSKKLYYVVMSSKASDNGKNAKGYRFYYGYNGRMHLDSIRVQDYPVFYTGSIGVHGSYRFKYDNFDNVPSDYLTTAYDHWGYYNGKEYTAWQIKDYAGFKSTRTPDFNYTKLGSLTEIQYPTGGVTVFEYEPNRFSKCMTDNRQSMKDSVGIGGGLRIKSITDYDRPDRKKMLGRRTFEYTYPGTDKSSGELFAAPKYYWPDWQAYTISSKSRSSLTTFRTTSIIPLSNSFGPSLGYTFVTEHDATGRKTVYRFSNLSDSGYKDEPFMIEFMGGKPSPYDEYSEKGFKRGKLLQQTLYDANGKKVRSTDYQYRTDNIDRYSTYTYNMGYVNNGNSASFGYYSGGVYKMYYPKFDITALHDTLFDGSRKAVTNTLYTRKDTVINVKRFYDHTVDTRLLKSESAERGGQSEKKVYWYNDCGNSLYSDMFCIKPVQVTNYTNGLYATTDFTIYKQIKFNGNMYQAPALLTRRNSRNNTDTLLICNNYTSTGALWMYTELGKPSTYIKWGYNDNYIMMKGNGYIPISFPDSIVFDREKCLARIVSYSKNNIYQFYGYAYDPFLGVTAMVYPRGYVIRYKYDSFGRLIGKYDEDGNAIQTYDYNNYENSEKK